MEIVPIVLSLWRRKLGAALIALQVALALAIVSNALLIIDAKLAALTRASGIDEDRIVLIFNQWPEPRDDGRSRVEADLTRLRSLPEVESAYATNSVPFGLAGTMFGIQRSSEQGQSIAQASLYMVDAQAVDTLGVRVLAGAWFTSQDLEPASGIESAMPSSVIVTRALAARVFDSEQVVGKTIYLDPSAPSTIVGVVERAAAHVVAGPDLENSVFAPYFIDSQRYYYVVRVKEPRRVEAAVQLVTSTLMAADRTRVLGFAMTFAEWRHRIQAGDRAVALVLSCVSGLLLLVTALGIVGLSSYWVARRRRQIGIRRALGARRIDIIRYFQIENFLVVLSGVALGSVGSIVLNLQMASRFEMERISGSMVGLGALLILALGQLSVFWPALRAAGTPPALAARAA